MKVKTLFQVFVLALLAFAGAFTVFPVSAKPVSAPLAADKFVYDFPCTINLNGNWKTVKEANGFTDQQLLDDINKLDGYPDPGGLTLSAVTGNTGHPTYGICEDKNIYTAIAGTVVRKAQSADNDLGWYVLIENGYGQRTYYAFMANPSDLVVGQTYPAKTFVGTMGCTGNTVGCSAGIVHFSQWVGTERQTNWQFNLDFPSTAAVSSITRANPNPTNLGSVNFNVNFSESVTGVDAGDFVLTKTGAIIGESVAGVSGSGSAYTVSVNTGTGDGTLRLDVPVGATITGLPTNLPYTSGEIYTVDKTPPTVISVVRVNPNPTNLPNVDFTVTFSEAVTGVDVGDFTGGASVSGSGSSYTVTVNTGADGNLCLDMSSATITDLVGNSLANPSFSGECYMVDKTQPTVEITLADANPTKLESVNFNVKFSEDVTGVDVGDFVLSTSSSISGALITGINPASGSGSSFIVTVNTGTGDGGQVAEVCVMVSPSPCGNLSLEIPAGATITDSATNSLAGLPKGANYTVDKTPPTVTITPPTNPSTVVITPPATSSTVVFTVTFSEDVTDVDIADFILTKTGKITGESITGVSPVTGPSSVYKVTVNPGAGEGNLHLEIPVGATITDIATNSLTGLPTGADYTVDKTPPTVVSIVPDNCNGNFIVTFSEGVTGVGVEDFSLTKNGTLSGVSIKEVTGGPVIYTVVVDTGKGEGTLDLDVPITATVNDLAGNPLTKLPYLNGKIYTILSEIFRSNGFGDGWVLESEEGSGLGGSVNSTAITFNMGDDAKNRQYRSVLHFPTAYLPDNAVALQSVLKIKKVEEVGAPFTSLGNLSVDIRNNLFVPGLGPLTTASFEAKADAYAVGTLSNIGDPKYPDGMGWYAAVLDGKASSYINPLGGTQIRLGFQTPTNKNGLTEYVKFYSGDTVGQKDRPHLEVRYCVPK